MCILSSVFGFFRHWPVTSLADHQLYHLTYHIGLRVYWFRTSFGCHCCEIFVLLQAPLVFMFVFLVVTFVFLVVSFARTLPFPSTVQFSLGRLSSPGAGRQATSDLGFPGPLVDTWLLSPTSYDRSYSRSDGPHFVPSSFLAQAMSAVQPYDPLYGRHSLNEFKILGLSFCKNHLRIMSIRLHSVGSYEYFFQ